METTRTVGAFRWDAPLGSVATILLLTLAVAAGEALLFYGEIWYAIVAYSVLLLSLSLAPLVVDSDVTLLQVFVLIPVFRLVNLTMPVFFELTLFWLPFVYAPFVLAIVYLGRQTTADEDRTLADGARTGREAVTRETVGQELPRWLGGERGSKPRRFVVSVWRGLAPPSGASPLRTSLHWLARGLVVLLVPLAAVAFLAALGGVTVYFAEVEFNLIRPAPLIPSLNEYYLALLVVVMVGFVGFVEELIFRGVLQQVFERALGVVPGLLLASALFGLMHAGTGVAEAVTFAFAVGLVFGVVYDLTDSLALVSVAHGLLNVLLFGVIPLDGGSSIDLLQPIVARLLRQFGLEGIGEWVGLVELLVVSGTI